MGNLPRLLILLTILWAAHAQGADGGALYSARCGVCHERSDERTPSREALSRMARRDIAAAATQGIMRAASEGLAPGDLQAIAAYLSPRADAGTDASPVCAAAMPRLNLDGPAWRGWGNGPHNPRFQPNPGLAAADIPRLRLKWVFRYDGPMTVGQPVLAGGTVFAGTQTGQILALDAATGCLRWAHFSGGPARTAISLGRVRDGRIAAWYGDDRAQVHAVDAQTGAAIWSRQLDTHVAARITGAPVLHQGRLYVPVSSGEEGWAKNPTYPCCTFRGAVVALDASNGDEIWRTNTIAEPAHPYAREGDGAKRFGPAGAAVWSAPTIDEARGVLYIGTGNSYTGIPETGSDSIMALSLATGAIKWARQLQAHDNYVVSCLGAGRAGQGNCPQDLGPDFDFGASTVLTAGGGGRDLLLAGQKSGTLFALDPDHDGREVWHRSLGAGSALGGIQWGMAVAEGTVFVPIADPYRREGGPPPRPGVLAVRILDGAALWRWDAPAGNCAWAKGRCLASNSAAATAIPGAVFAGGSDGHLRAYRAGDGAVIWDFDTAGQDFAAVNGGSARGGSIDNGGPVVAGGMVLVNSGYGRQLAHAGNALLAFTVDGR